MAHLHRQESPKGAVPQAEAEWVATVAEAPTAAAAVEAAGTVATVAVASEVMAGGLVEEMDEAVSLAVEMRVVEASWAEQAAACVVAAVKEWVVKGWDTWVVASTEAVATVAATAAVLAAEAAATGDFDLVRKVQESG